MKIKNMNPFTPVSIVTEGCSFEGTMTFENDARIGGQIQGNVISKKMIIVETTGFIEGLLEAESIIIFGHVKGDIKALKSLHLMSSCLIEGDIHTIDITVESGARISGKVWDFALQNSFTQNSTIAIDEPLSS